MYSKAKPMKVDAKRGRKKNDSRRSRRSGSYIVRSKSGRVMKEPNYQVETREKGKRSVYGLMYDQEAKDIERAMGVLDKFAQN